MRSVTFLSKTNLFIGSMINLPILNVIALFCTHHCNSASNLNIRTIISVLESLECVLFFNDNTLPFCISYYIFPDIYKKKRHLRWRN